MTPKTRPQIEAAITKIEALIKKGNDKLYSPQNRVPGGGDFYSGSSVEGKRIRKLKNTIGKNQDKLDTLRRKSAKLPLNEKKRHFFAAQFKKDIIAMLKHLKRADMLKSDLAKHLNMALHDTADYWEEND